MTEQTNEKQTDLQIVTDIVRTAQEKGQDEDAMMIAIIKNGIKFSSAANLVRKAKVELGLLADSADVQGAAGEEIEKLDSATPTLEQYQSLVEAVQGRVQAATSRQVLTAITKAAKARNVTLPAAATGGGGRGRPSFVSALAEAVRETGGNLNLEDFIAEHANTEKMQKVRMSQYGEIFAAFQDLLPDKGKAAKSKAA